MKKNSLLIAWILAVVVGVFVVDVIREASKPTLADDFNFETKKFHSPFSKLTGINTIISGQINDSVFSALPGITLTSVQKEKFIELLKKHCAAGYDNALTEQDIYCLCLLFSAIESDDRVNIEGVDFERSLSGWSQKEALQKMQLAMSDAFRKSMAEVNKL